MSEVPQYGPDSGPGLETHGRADGLSFHLTATLHHFAIILCIYTGMHPGFHPRKMPPLGKGGVASSMFDLFYSHLDLTTTDKLPPGVTYLRY